MILYLMLDGTKRGQSPSRERTEGQHGCAEIERIGTRKTLLF